MQHEYLCNMSVTGDISFIDVTTIEYTRTESLFQMTWYAVLDIDTLSVKTEIVTQNVKTGKIQFVYKVNIQ